MAVVQLRGAKRVAWATTQFSFPVITVRLPLSIAR
jgi:hypothetical protein